MPPKIKQHASNFFCTINSNSTDSRYKQLVKDAWEECVDNIEAYLVVTDPSLVHEILQPMAGVEAGPQKKLIHLHGFVQVRHKTKCQINLPKTRKFFNQALGVSAYFNVKHIPDSSINIQNYIQKSLLQLDADGKKE